jgi:sec-independent protein translocase protein TatA
MPNIGPMELIIVAVIALMVLGPKRLPDAGKSLGKGLREFKGAIAGRDDDDDDREARELAAIQPVEPVKVERRETEPVA